MKYHFFFFGMLFSFLGMGLQAQYATNFTIKDGLPSNHVYKVTQDPLGFIWTLTDNGIVKYNGNDFKIFTTKDGLPTNDIWEIEITPDGKVWFFCKASKMGYIENDTVYAFEGQIAKNVFFPLRIISYENQILFESTEDWFFLNTNKKWQGVSTTASHPLNKMQRSIDSIVASEGPNNIFHLRAKDSLIFWVKQDNYHVLNTNTNKAVNGKKDHAFDQVLSSFSRINSVNGSLQITDKDYLAVLDQRHQIVNEFTVPSSYECHNIILDKTENLWGVSLQKGVFKIPSSYQKLDYFFPNEKIVNIDKVGDQILINVFNEGFLNYHPLHREFTPFIMEKGVLNPLSISDSLKRFDFIHKMKMTTYDFNNPNPIKEQKLTEGIKQLIYKDAFFWGIGSFEIKKIHVSNMEVVDRFPAIGTNKLFVFNNSIIVGSTDGLKYLKDNQVQTLDENPIFQKPVSNIVAFNNQWFLVCTEGYGAYATNTREVIIFPNTNSLIIQDAYVQDNLVWLATSEGLYEFKKEGKQFEFIRNSTETLDLSVQKINTVFVQDNIIYLGTDNGLYVFPKEVSATSQFLDIYFKEILFNEEPLALKNEVRYTANNSLRVGVSSIDYSERKLPNSYEYKLEPIHDQWITTTSPSLDFSNLAPNKYQLSLRKGVLEKTYGIQVLPLWWQTLLFKIIVGVLLIGFLLIILYLIRKFELKKKTAKLNAQKKLAEYELYALRSQMNPHFVFNSLTAIQYYINENDFENSEKYLVKFSKLIRQFFDISKEEEIFLEDEITLLRSYLEIEKLRFRDKLNFTIDVASNLDIKKNKIPTMLLQPIVENAVNHGIFNKEGNGTIAIEFLAIDTNKYSVEIIDDGVGVQKTMKSKNGKLSSSIVIRDRISILNQSQDWDITFVNKIAFSNTSNKGNKARFTIHNLR